MLANINFKQELKTYHQAGTILTLHWVSPARSETLFHPHYHFPPPMCPSAQKKALTMWMSQSVSTAIKNELHKLILESFDASSRSCRVGCFGTLPACEEIAGSVRGVAGLCQGMS
jgi:hypothetical protein